ncbi:MAG: CHAT domain-containing protein [Chthoniobacterales bacterium]
MICLAAVAILFLAEAPTPDAVRQNLLQAFERGNIEKATEIAVDLASEKTQLRGADSDLAVNSANAALLSDYTGDYERAEALYLKAMQFCDRVSSTDPAMARLTLGSLFALYVNTGMVAKAEAIARRDPKVQDEDPAAPTGSLASTNRGRDWIRARRLLASGWTSYLHGDTDAARARATSVAETCRRIDARPSLADALNLLATVHYKRGEYDEAQTLYTEALTVSTAAHYIFGNARNWSSLGSIAYRQGDYRAALESYEKSKQARERLGNSDELARALNDIANVHQEMGAYDRAVDLRRQALRLWKETGNDVGIADVLNDIAWVYQNKGDNPKALSYLEQARELHEQIHDRWGVADDLDGIGLAHSKTGNHEQALESFRNALRGFTELGNSEECARVQLHMGDTLHHLNRLAEAATAFEAALALYEKAFGAASPRTSETLAALARVAIDLGEQSRAIGLAERSVNVSEIMLANVLSFTSERQRLEFQATTDPYSLLASLECGPRLATTLLRNKGIVLDSLLEDRLVAEASNDREKRERVARLRSAKQRLIQLSLETSATDPGSDALQKHDLEKSSLTREVEELEAGLAREIAGLGRARRALSVTVPQIQAALPADQALIELVRYQHYLGGTKVEPRYGGVVILRAGEPKWVSLGNAAEIEKSIRLYQRTARGETTEAVCAAVVRTLEREVWGPIEKLLPGQTKSVIISPDGALSFISFATLVGPDNRFLSERYSIRYVASGRDLLRANSAAASEEIDVYAEPDFGRKSASPASSKSDATRSVSIRDLQNVQLRPLPGTAREAEGLKQRAGKTARVFVGPNASERELRRTKSPRVLHLATHGFFLSEPDRSRTNIPKGRLENPMHRSGVALAGAQSTLAAWARGEIPPTEDDGIVTAEEVGALELEGTKLVVLSACETGSGEARAGEGVLGLRRGFVQAGATNLLMTLWPISDETTVQIMFDFYDAALKDADPADVLAKVQRDWLVKLRREHGLLAAVRLAGPFVMSSQGKP